MAPKILDKGEAKDKNINVRVPQDKYKELQDTASSLGMPMASMIRTLLYGQLEKAKKAKDPSVFIKTK